MERADEHRGTDWVLYMIIVLSGREKVTVRNDA